MAVDQGGASGGGKRRTQPRPPARAVKSGPTKRVVRSVPRRISKSVLSPLYPIRSAGSATVPSKVLPRPVANEGRDLPTGDLGSFPGKFWDDAGVTRGVYTVPFVPPAPTPTPAPAHTRFLYPIRQGNGLYPTDRLPDREAGEGDMVPLAGLIQALEALGLLK